MYAVEGREAESLPKLLGRGWREALRSVLEEVSVKIDLQVTQDTSRLTRIPGTLNGKASLLVTYVEDPSSFRPDKDLSPFDGEVEVELLEDVEGKILGKSLSLRKGESVSLEAWVAVTLITKGLARPLGGEVIVRESPSWRSIQGVRWPPRVVEYGAPPGG